MSGQSQISKLQMALLTLLVLFSPLAIDIYLPALPLISNTFSVEHALAQDTITWFLFAMGVGQLFAGPLADKLGRRNCCIGRYHHLCTERFIGVERAEY